MLTSFALIFLIGLAMGAIFQKLGLPRLMGMLVAGIFLGPSVCNVLDDQILTLSPELRKLALIIILLKAGLSLDLADLKKVGRPAILLAFVPASFEILAYVFLAPLFFEMTRLEAALMGTVLAAVSPAIVVPRAVQYLENKWGSKQSIPQMIMAGASCDDIFVIVLFTTFLGMAQGEATSLISLFNIPLAIILGTLLGAIVGALLAFFFETAYRYQHGIRNSLKVIVILAVAFLLVAIETWLQDYLAVSGLLATVSMACVLRRKSQNCVTQRLAEKFGKLWLAAEPILFVLVGAALSLSYTLEAGGSAVALIFLALVIRAFGVLVSTALTKLSLKERFFCVLAYLPKATVQAAIGGLPLATGLPCGKMILSVAVLAILITAPLGALAMDHSYQSLLQRD